jgi:hypothetical protein
VVKWRLRITAGYRIDFDRIFEPFQEERKAVFRPQLRENKRQGRDEKAKAAQLMPGG